MCKLQTTSETPDYKPKYEMQDIFKLYGDDYISRHKLNSMQLKAIRDISECSDCKNLYLVSSEEQVSLIFSSCSLVFILAV